MQKLRPNASAVVGMVLLVAGAVSLVFGVDAPSQSAQAAETRVIRVDEGGHVLRLDDRELERDIERAIEDALGGLDAEEIARTVEMALEGLGDALDVDFDFEPGPGAFVWHGDGHDWTDEDRERFEARMQAFEERMSRHGERIASRVGRAMERLERDLDRADRDHVWVLRGDRDYDARDAQDAERRLRREIRQLERRLEHLQQELDELQRLDTPAPRADGEDESEGER